MFSINSLAGFNFITCDVRLSYRQPAVSRYTENGNIPSSIEVSMYLKTTLNTFERMSFPVSFVDMSANRTFLACVPRVNSYNRFTHSFSLISEKLVKFIERPIIEFASKICSFSSALNSYTGQIFNSKNIKRHRHNSLRDTVIDPGNKPLLFPADLPEKFFSRFSAFALKFRSKICVLCPHVLDRFTIEKSIIGSHGDINDPPINSKNLIANGFRRKFMNNHMQIKSILLSVISQRGRFKFPIKILPVIFRNGVCCSHSPLNRRKTNILFDKIDSMHTLIIPNSREWFACRTFFKFESLERFAGNISDSLKNRTWKFRMLFPDTVISGTVDRYLAASMVFKTVSGNFIENLIAQSHCLSKRFFIFLRQFQFQFNRSFHSRFHYNKGLYSHYDNDVKVLFWGGVRSLPVLKYGVSSTPAPRRTQ